MSLYFVSKGQTAVTKVFGTLVTTYSAT